MEQSAETPLSVPAALRPASMPASGSPTRVSRILPFVLDPGPGHDIDLTGPDAGILGFQGSRIPSASLPPANRSSGAQITNGPVYNLLALPAADASHRISRSQHVSEVHQGQRSDPTPDPSGRTRVVDEGSIVRTKRMRPLSPAGFHAAQNDAGSNVQVRRRSPAASLSVIGLEHRDD